MGTKLTEKLISVFEGKIVIGGIKMTQEELNKALALLKKDNKFKRLSFFSSHAHRFIFIVKVS